MVTGNVRKFVFYVVLPLAIAGFFISPLRGKVCISEFRLADPQQQIDAALEDYIRYLRHGEFKDPAPPRKITRRIDPPFTTIEDLTNRFQNCCNLVRFSESDYGSPNWFEWLSGKVGSHVNIELQIPYIGDNGEPLRFAQSQVIPVSTCGSIRTDRFYTPIGGL